MWMSKALIILFVVLSLLVSGCASQSKESEQTNAGALGNENKVVNGNNDPALTDNSLLGNGSRAIELSEEEIEGINTEISELESLLEDSDLSSTEFLELDESTFE